MIFRQFCRILKLNFIILLAEETLGGELALLDHPARHVFIFKRKQTGDQVEVITRKLTDTECLTRHLRYLQSSANFSPTG